MLAPARTIRIAPTNSFDAEEMALIEMSRLQRAVWFDRWEHILIDAGEHVLAEAMAAENRKEIA